MNNYHLYEEIGHGKHSVVYKGRKRHSIRYVAVKSIEKTRRDKVMIEVSILQKLHHTNVVGFFSWHETRNHLWIIFEFCAGGDLLRMLKQDGRFPEDQVRRFGRDVCAGLLHLHAHAVIYSDLKPANLLSDEEGRLKLSDLGSAQRLDEIERLIEDNEVVPRRGTPHYMAPELFQEGGMHSFASDFWALGCVLYEMLTGRPPFHSSSFERLQELVQSDSPPVLPDATPDFQAIAGSLLSKSPLDRPSWSLLRRQRFWRGRAPGEDEDEEVLPVQPHWEELKRWWGSCGNSVVSSMAASLVSAVNETLDTASSTVAEPEGSPRESEESLGHYSRRASDTRFELPLAEAATAVPAPAWPPASAGGEATPLGEPEAEQEPPYVAPLDLAAAAAAAAAAPDGGSNAHGGGAVARLAAAAGAAVAGGCAQHGGLRLRLGASFHARLREIVGLVETGVRPISRNPQIEEPESLDGTSNDLPFMPLRFEDVCSLPHAELQTYLTRVYKCIAQSTMEHKIGALRYLEQICCHMQVADIIVNSSILKLVLRMLHAHRNVGGVGPATGAVVSKLRARLLSFVGQLLRHATYLEPGVADMGIFEALLEGMHEDSDGSVRRRSAAALGELLFYVATQPPPPQQPAEDAGGRGDASWTVPDAVLQTLARTMMEAPPVAGAAGGRWQSDEVVQHYVVKTIENIATMCPEVAHRWFFSVELLHALERHVAQSASDPFRLSCLATIGHLLRGTSQQELLVAALAQVESSTVLVGATELAPQGVSHTVHIFSHLVLCDPSGEAVRAWLPHDVLDHLLVVLSQARFPGALRSRTLVLLALLFALDDPSSAQHLRVALERCFVKEADRLAREKEGQVEQSLLAVEKVMEVVVLSTMQSLTEKLRSFASVVDLAAAEDYARSIAEVLPVLNALIASVSLCGCVLNAKALPLLGAACELTMRATYPQFGPGSRGHASNAVQQLQPLILNVIEALGTQQVLLLEYAPQTVRSILPALAACLSSSRSDVRLHALKAFSGICILFLSDNHICGTWEAPSETFRLLEALLCSRALPTLPSLLLDEPPAPAYALRLLSALSPRESQAVRSTKAELRLVQPLLAALGKEQGLTLYSALLVHNLLRAREVRVRDVRDAGVLDSAQATLGEAAEVAMGHPGQMDLALLDAALCIAEEALDQCKLAFTAGAARLQPWGGREDVQAGLVDIGPLVLAAPPLAALTAPLAHSRLLQLLSRVTSCLHHLVELARMWSHEWSRVGAQPSSRGLGSMLEALMVLGRWRPEGGGGALPSVQLLETLSWALALCSNADVRAEVAMGVERLLRDRLLEEDPSVLAEARALLAVAKAPLGPGPSVGPPAAGGGRGHGGVGGGVFHVT